MAAHQLEYIALISTDPDHVESFAEQIERASSFSPLLIVSHSARDFMPYEDQCRFFEKALEVEKEAAIPIAHETHCGHSMFAPWTTSRLLY